MLVNILLVKKDKDLAQFPPGGVLVAKHTSPKYIAVMNQASAIITDIGKSYFGSDLGPDLTVGSIGPGKLGPLLSPILLAGRSLSTARRGSECGGDA